jgi:hypothetical protein
MKLKIIATILTCALLISEACFAQANLSSKSREQQQNIRTVRQAFMDSAKYTGSIGVGSGLLVGFGCQVVSSVKTFIDSFSIENLASGIQSADSIDYRTVKEIIGVSLAFGLITGTIGGSYGIAKHQWQTSRNCSNTQPPESSPLSCAETKSDAAADRPTLLS